MIKFNRRTAAPIITAAALVIVIIVFNTLFAINYRLIIASFSTDNTDFDNGKVEEALALGDEVVQNIAEEGIVLLKNENALPLKDGERKINFFGYGSSDSGFILTGGGSGASVVENASNKDKKITLYNAFERQGFEYNEELAEIYTGYSSINADAGNGRMVLNEPSPEVYTDKVIENAKNFSDIAVVTISRYGRESFDIPRYQEKYIDGKEEKSIDYSRTYLQLSREEEGMLDIVCGNFKKVIVLLNIGNPIEAGFLNDERISAALYVGFTGQSGALAIPKILTGEVTPSGALTSTYAYSHDEYNPTAANVFRGVNKDSQLTYAEGIYFGYRWYETADAEGCFDGAENAYGVGYDAVVQYPFGYGLSYTNFEWRVDGYSPKQFTNITANTKIEIKVTVINSGDFCGRDTVQIYGTPNYVDGGIEKAEKNLLAFAKTQLLNPGDSQQLTLTFSAYDMASYDGYDSNGNGFCGYELDGGKYTVRLMHNAHMAAVCPNAEIVYNVAEAVKFRRDPKTNVPVRNKFTGETAYAGVPIDGSSVGAQPIKYLSRSNFEDTFPAERTPLRTKLNVIESANEYKYAGYDSVEKPVTSSGGNLKLVVREDGSPANMADLQGNTDVELKYNSDLVKALGNDYRNPQWEALLDQMSVEDLCVIVEAGGFQTEACESIGKPRRRDSDGPAGFNLTSSYGAPAKWTSYPNQALLACSWNQSLAYDMGRAQGVEANATSISGWYAPYMNMYRNAYGGRSFESCGEDPVLTGVVCAEIVRGAKNLGLYAYMKHFAVCEEGVNPDNLKVWLTEQTLREIYLKPFEIAVKRSGANAVMTAHNCVGAVWAGANYALNEGILRGEWGFCGSLVTDYSYQRDFMNAEQALRGGNDFMLDVSASYSKLDRIDPVNLFLARKSAKNIIYTWANTYAAALEYAANGGGGDGFNTDITVKPMPLTFSPAPIIMLVFTDALLCAGTAVSLYFAVVKSRDMRRDSDVKS